MSEGIHHGRHLLRYLRMLRENMFTFKTLSLLNYRLSLILSPTWQWSRKTFEWLTLQVLNDINFLFASRLVKQWIRRDRCIFMIFHLAYHCRCLYRLFVGLERWECVIHGLVYFANVVLLISITRVHTHLQVYLIHRRRCCHCFIVCIFKYATNSSSLLLLLNVDCRVAGAMLSRHDRHAHHAWLLMYDFHIMPLARNFYILMLRVLKFFFLTLLTHVF